MLGDKGEKKEKSIILRNVMNRGTWIDWWHLSLPNFFLIEEDKIISLPKGIDIIGTDGDIWFFEFIFSVLTF